jgi:hypothetical protein
MDIDPVSMRNGIIWHVSRLEALRIFLKEWLRWKCLNKHMPFLLTKENGQTKSNIIISITNGYYNQITSI